MDSKVFIKYILTVLLLYINPTKGCKGCVDLDDYNFEKVITKFPVTLVKFDVAYPYGEKHDIYGKFSEESSKINDLLFAEVGVKDYGEMDNENLAESYGITRDDYPAVRLYKKSTKDPISFPNDAEFTVDSLRTFVRDNTDIYIGLAGCLEQYDNLAKEFMTSEKQEDVLKKAEEVSNKLSEKEKISAKIYTIIMQKVITNGKKFLNQENERVTKLLKGKITQKKKGELQDRLNILRAFVTQIKDEL